MKGERMAKRSSFGNIMRRRLSDITNTQSPTELIGFMGEQPQISKLIGLIGQQPQASEFTPDLINQLLQACISKIIELSGNKLRDLRMNYQKLQAQNRNLAQSNSQMLAELNLGREKLKALQHEVVCKDALLKAKNLEPRGKADLNCQKVVSQVVEKIEEEGCLPQANNDIKPCSRSRRRTARSRSMGPSTTNRQTVEKEKAETKRLDHFHHFAIKHVFHSFELELGLQHAIPFAMGLKLCKSMQKTIFFRVLLYPIEGLVTISEIKNIRSKLAEKSLPIFGFQHSVTWRCVRRQSARSREREPAENLFEIEDVKFPVCNSRAENGPTPSIMKDVKFPVCNSRAENGPTPSIMKEETCEPRNETQVSHRSSIGRPSRRAAEKIQSYKEVPVNVKMRRAE
ncbi:unnamed protein product [Dovyalis caffra]|uniref:Shugoshin C-terminal domain-containing protein n=1 Tax=Dovyalis caffra TaxID=77055 RepID=A0AAV1RBA5_9ROSI|nr:unnamed protein product [Dovyalis caffra]